MSRGPSALSALIAVNKPAGMTSFDVVARVRRAVGERRVGHAGTLDPAATGVLVVGIGQATKLLGLLTLDRKGYRTRIDLGSQTTTDDAEGEIVASSEVPARLLDAHVASGVVRSLEGTYDQVPPVYSAISVGGKRAYALARAGEDPKLAARPASVFRASLLEVLIDERAWVIDLEVSKGTYVRSIARDLGRDLGCYAHVGALERTFAGPVGLDDCVSLDELVAGGVDLVRARCLDPTWALGLARRDLAPSELLSVSNGRPIELGHVVDRHAERDPRPQERVCLVWDGALAGIWARRGARLACETNFPQAIEGVQPTLSQMGPATPLGAGAGRRLVSASLLDRGEDVGCELPFSLVDGAATGRLVVRRPASDAVDQGAGPLAWAHAIGHERRFTCAIGAFDGFHRGHRALLARAREEADRAGARLAVVTFSPDPARVLDGADAARDLLCVEDRERALLGSGVDLLVTVDFTTALAALTYERFVCDVLEALVELTGLVVGSDFRLGALGAGTVDALTELGRARGFDVVGMSLADALGGPVTASRIRGLVAAGKVEEATGLLGRCHFVRGQVEHGRGEGTGLGFPTANVRVDAHACLPAEGVYAGFVVVPDEGALVAWPAAINVGKPLTFEPGAEGQAFLEATLLGFSGDLYGENVRVVFARWLRAPERFSSVDELERVVLGNVEWVRRTLGECGMVLRGEGA